MRYIFDKTDFQTARKMGWHTTQSIAHFNSHDIWLKLHILLSSRVKGSQYVRDNWALSSFINELPRELRVQDLMKA